MTEQIGEGIPDYQRLLGITSHMTNETSVNHGKGDLEVGGTSKCLILGLQKRKK